MDVVYTQCAGLDVHKKTVVAAIIVPDGQGGLHKETRTFGTMTTDLLTLSDWLVGHSVTHAAMESTGEYWKPPFNILESNFEVMLVNAQHVKAVPGQDRHQRCGVAGRLVAPWFVACQLHSTCGTTRDARDDASSQ